MKYHVIYVRYNNAFSYEIMSSLKAKFMKFEQPHLINFKDDRPVI